MHDMTTDEINETFTRDFLEGYIRRKQFYMKDNELKEALPNLIK